MSDVHVFDRDGKHLEGEEAVTYMRSRFINWNPTTNAKKCNFCGTYSSRFKECPSCEGTDFDDIEIEQR